MDNEKLNDVIEKVDEDLEEINGSTTRGFEMILYVENGATKDTIINALEGKSIKSYAFILHDKDKDTKPHFHVMIWLYTAWEKSALVKWFKPFNATLANMGKIKNRKGALAYLTHSNRPEKYQYSLEDVTHTEDIKEELETVTAEAVRKREIRSLCDKVANGLCSPKTLINSLSGTEYRDNQKLVDSSINARLLKSSIKKDRNMKVYYIVGKAGSGKSTLARWLASHLSEETPYISSSSNDPLQDYMLEEAIILDDLRADAFKFADLLKLTDNYVPSSVKCRYRNKSIDAKYLFITSTRWPDELYSSDTFNKDDNLQQLFRRLNKILYIKNGKVVECFYKPVKENGITKWVRMRKLDEKADMKDVFLEMNVLESLTEDVIDSVFDSLTKKGVK